MSLEQQLESDLRAIIAETKRKHPALSNAAEQAVASLKQSVSIPVAALMLPLQRLPNPPTPKLTNLSLAFVNRMVTNDLVDSVNTDVLLQVLSVFAEPGEELGQLKILQILMLILNPNGVILTDELVAKVTTLTMNLRRMKSTLVKNTAAACMKHLVRLTFDKLSGWAAQARDPPEALSAASFAKLSYEAQAIYECAERLLNSTVEMCSDPDKGISAEGLDLVASMISDCKEWLGLLPEYMRVIDTLCETVFPRLYSDPDPTLQRKFITCVIQTAEITVAAFPAVGKLLEIVDSGHVLDTQVLHIIDDLPILCQSHQSIKRLFLYEHGTIFTQLLYVVSKVCNQALTHFDRKRSVKTQEDIGKGSVQVLSGIVKSIFKLTEAAKVQPDRSLSKSLNAEQKVCEDLVNAIWKQLLPTLSIILNCPLTDEALHLGLNSFQQMISMAGALNLSPARETYINALTGILGTQELVLCQRGSLAAKAVLNIAHSLGQVLDSKNWKKVLDTLHRVEAVYVATAPADDRGKTEFQAFIDELAIMYKNTNALPDQALVDLILALGQLTIENMEGLAAVEKSRREAKLFGVHRMIDVALVNLQRIPLFWDNITGYLDLICSSKHVEARTAGTKALSTLTVAAFKYLSLHTLSSDQEKWRLWQPTVLKTLEEYVKSSSSENHSSLYFVVFELLEKCGDLLQPEGWELLIHTLSYGNKESHIVRTHCVQIIVERFLVGDGLSNCVEQLIALMSQILLSPDEMTIETDDVLPLFGKVGDWLAQTEGHQDTWLLLFDELKILGEEGTPELRKSALQVLTKSLTDHAGALEPETWVRVIGDIVLSSLQKISASYLQHAVREEEVPVLELPKFGGSAQSENHAPKKGKKSLQISIPSDSAVPLVKETPKFAGATESHFKIEKGPGNFIRQDSLEKQWEDTFTGFLVHLGPIFQAYLSHCNSATDQSNAAPRKHWDLLVLRLKEGIHYGTINVVTHVLAAIRDLVSEPCAMDLFLSKWRTSWELYSTLCNRLQVSSAAIPQDLMNVCLENLMLIYAKGSASQEALGEKVLQVLFSILNFFFTGCRNESALYPNSKLNPEEQRIFEFVEWIGSVLAANGDTARIYLHFLMGLAVYNPADPHTDAISRGALSAICTFSVQHSALLVPVLPLVLEKFWTLMTLRFNEESYLLLSISAKGGCPLWEFASRLLLDLLPVIMKFDCWDKILDVFEAVLNPEAKEVAGLISAKLINEVVVAAEEIDVKYMEFIKEKLVPASMTKHANIQWRLLSLLDAGCTNYYRKATEVTQTLPSRCLEYLFDLSKVRPATVEEQEKASISEEPIAIKIAKRATPVLIARCKEMLKQHLTDEKALGSDLPSQRTEELIAVLKCLKALELPEQTEGGKKKGHLVELFPLFTELVETRDEEVRMHLKEIFVEVGKILQASVTQ